jgi:arylsulfatase A-like enzyme
VDRLTNQSNQQVLTPDIYNELRARVEAGHGTQLDQTDLDFISGLYETAVRYADMQVGVFLEVLDERGLLETSTVIVLSDHGEGLMDHGFVTHRPALRDAEVHVPLLIRPPGGLSGGATIDTTTSLIDVAPTALSLVGLSVPDSMDGRDLSGCLRGDCPGGEDDGGYAISESVLDMVSVTDGQHRLVVTEGTRTLYDAGDQAVTDQAVSARLWSALEERM